jgi:hypothetical protein
MSAMIDQKTGVTLLAVGYSPHGGENTPAKEHAAYPENIPILKLIYMATLGCMDDFLCNGVR